MRYFDRASVLVPRPRRRAVVRAHLPTPEARPLRKHPPKAMLGLRLALGRCVKSGKGSYRRGMLPPAVFCQRAPNLSMAFVGARATWSPR
jgi:hypothetical protein